MDKIQELGSLAFGSRLKRLSDRFLGEGAKIYALENIDFQPRWFPLFYLLGSEGEKTITEAAADLRLTHPAITQMSQELIRARIIISGKDKKDARKRIIQLSANGRGLFKKMQPLWRDIHDSIEQILNEVPTPLLQAIEELENILDQKSFYERTKNFVEARRKPAKHSGKRN